MIVLHNLTNRRSASLEALAGIVERRHMLPTRPAIKVMANIISDDMPEAGGGGASADATGAPEAASSTDDDGGDDGEDDCRRPRLLKSPAPFPPALLAFAPLSHYVGFGRSRIYQLINAGEFPPL